MADQYGIDLKYTHTAVAGDMETISGLDNLKEALLRRWLTEPGSFLYRPGYGAGLLKFQNQPLTLSVQRQIAKAIEDQTARDLRVESVRSIRVKVSDNNPYLIEITVSIKPRGYGEQTINFTLESEV